MRILIFGNGYLASEYTRANIFNEVYRSSADITHHQQIQEETRIHHPDAIINCAGKTNLEWCRDNQLQALFSNVVGPLFLLRMANEMNIPLVHIGSGCIFEGIGEKGQGFTENDTPNPQCFYSYTKVMADNFLMQANTQSVLIIRIRQPFSEIQHPRNLITKLITYEKLIISPNSMTYVPDLVATTKFLLEKKQFGIFNICNPSTISPYEIGVLAKKYLGSQKNIIPISKEELDDMDKHQHREKRVDTIINTNKLQHCSIFLEDVHTRIKFALQQYRT